jgi:D-alanyl-D-alanine dipeptidase
VAPAAGAATVAAITLFGRRWFPPYDEFARAHPSAAEQLADACYALTALGTLAGLAWAVARPRSAAADCDGDTPPNAVSDSRSAEGA